MTKTAAVFSSRLAPALKRYVDLKRALGRRFDDATRTLQLLDRFLQGQTIRYPDLNAAAFQAWCQTQEHLASGGRRGRMREVYNFCLYRLRTEPQCFVPDPVLFPKPHQRLQPYIFSEQSVAKLLRASSGLKRGPSSPLRPEVIRLAIVLLFTTGIRRGELLRLTMGDYDHLPRVREYEGRALTHSVGRSNHQRLAANGPKNRQISRYLKSASRAESRDRWSEDSVRWRQTDCPIWGFWR
jgi:integrase/recombinase XerD